MNNTLISALLSVAALAASAGPVRIAVDATQAAGTLEPFWASQIIHPTEALLTDWGKGFLQMLKETGAARQYVRIYNQPEAAARVAADGTVAYAWDRFDEMADLILMTGCKLEVMFFGLPEALAAHPEALLKRSNGSRVCISPPKDYGQWEALCTDFTRHVLKRYGEAEVVRWRFTCWNEPDLKGFWYKSDMAEYLKLYDHFAKAVKEVCPAIRVGGPALSSTKTYQNPQDYKLFLEHAVRGVNHATGGVGAPLDFIGVHTYGGSGGGGGPGRNFPDVAYMIEQQLRYADLRDAYPQLKGLPIHVEEWGETSGGTTGVSEKKPTADVRNSECGSAFLIRWVAEHIRMRQENDRHFEAFTFCASGYEKAPARDFMGYRTLDTKSGFHKPILNAYKLLNRLGPTLVKTEVGSPDSRVSAFAARAAGRVAVVLVNYQCDQIDSDKGAACPVVLSVVTPWGRGGVTTMRHWRIDSRHSNAYAAFKAIGSPADPTPAQIAEVKARMGLELLEPARRVDENELAGLRFDLPCNAVSLVEFVPGTAGEGEAP